MDELPREVIESAQKSEKLADERAKKCKVEQAYLKQIDKLRSQHEVMIMQLDANNKLLQVISQQLNTGMFAFTLVMSLFVIVQGFLRYGF